MVSIRVIRGGKKLTHSIALDKFVRFVFKIILISRPPEKLLEMLKMHPMKINIF